MGSIKIWIKSLTGFVFICAVIEALVPEAPTKRTLRMLLGVVMSVLVIGPIVGVSLAETDIFEESSEYINYEDNTREMQALTEKQTRQLYENSALQTVEKIIGEKTEMEIVFSEENEIEKVIIHKIAPEKKADIAAALGVLPSKLQMTE
ncbi:MAG: stage III sporulation protein AF [Clostridia bacterium]|nr:stage III sporulation protein AF [Clostridia bacterium]